MTSSERIKSTLRFEIPDRVGIYDCLRDDTERLWKENNLIPQDSAYQEFFNYDLALFELGGFSESGHKKAKAKDLFLALALSDPFQQSVSRTGLEGLLLLLAEDPKKAAAIFSAGAEDTLKRCQALFDKGFSFDGVWIWSDLAYKTGCYFSVDTYKKLLHPFHKELFSFFNSRNLPVILHSDGDISAFIPLLLKAGVRALNPLEASSGFDIGAMKKEYAGDLVIMGNMPVDVLYEDRRGIEEALSERLEIAKNGGGFIYHSDQPIPATVPFGNYAFALEIVRKYGAYR